MHDVRVRVEHEEELYNSLDPSGTLLSDEVKSYIFDRVQQKSFREEVEFTFVSPEEIDRERLEGALCRWADEEVAIIESERRRNLVQQLRLLAVGLVFVGVSVAVQRQIDGVSYTLLSTIGVFSIWEAANIWVVENPHLKLRLRTMHRVRRRVGPLIEKEGD